MFLQCTIEIGIQNQNDNQHKKVKMEKLNYSWTINFAITTTGYDSTYKVELSETYQMAQKQ